MSEHGSEYGESNHPDTNCRTCTDFKTWSTNMFKTSKKSESSAKPKIIKDDGGHRREDCPLDKAELGRKTWGLLHTIGANYPNNPNENHKKDAIQFVDILSRIYPCPFCAADFRNAIKKHPVDASSQKGLSLWLCKMHNNVNKKLGKPLFDCSKVNERWKDGWLDGSCD